MLTREMKDSGVEWIGKIPKDWEIVPLTKQLDSIVDYRGKTPEKTEEPKEDIKPAKKENRKIHKKKDSLDDISVDDIGLGNIVNKIIYMNSLIRAIRGYSERAMLFSLAMRRILRRA